MNNQTEMFPGLPPARERVGTGKAARMLGPKGGKHYTQPRGYAATPGGGPKGETCKTCAHYCRVPGGARAYPKCGLLRKVWTGGPGTDIKASSPACELWAKPEGSADK